MCGIVGVVHRDLEQPVEPGVIRTMCRAIRHRGPDDEGLFVSGQVGLGMRRLSIIDLEGGRQPIANEDGSKVIVFNGEIYNYPELRADLIQRRHVFRTASDTETIVHLYEEAGPAAVERLRGMFAFALWDSEHRSLCLARDRFGIKPLYYVATPWGLAFASELKALVAGGLTGRELDWEALDAYFQLGYIPAPASPFRDVRKLPPGHWLMWRPSGELQIHQYWDLPRHAAAAPPEPERHVLEWLDESVAAHLISDVPVAAFLSGGLDSSAVVASMALAAPGGDAVPQAFTARYFGSGAAAADETELARQLASRYGVRLNVVDITPDVRDTFEPIVRALDEPHADDSAIPTWALSRVVGSSHKVALTGIGGDELFAGYRRHLGLVAAERYARLPGALRRAAARVAQLLPARVKVGRWEHKHLLRRALATRLPSAHFQAPKRGFVGPTAAWLRRELRPLLEDELSADRTRRLGYFDAAALTRLLADHFSRRHNREGILWALLCFSTWHRIYLEPPGVAPYHPTRAPHIRAPALVGEPRETPP